MSYKGSKIRVRIIWNAVEVYNDLLNEEQLAQHMYNEHWNGVWNTQFPFFDHGHFWNLLNTGTRFSSDQLLSFAMCNGMNVARLLYDSPISKIEIYGLKNMAALTIILVHCTG